MSLNSSTGEISGIPTSTGLYSFTVQVTDADLQTAQQNLTLTVTPGPSISYGYVYLPSAEVGSAYSNTLQASNGTTPYTWSSGDLPSELSINSSTGEISGTPTDPGLHSFTIQVADTNLQSDYRTFNLIAGIPLSNWTFSTTDDFSDGGIGVIAGQRTIVMGGGGTSGGYAQISKTITGLTNGTNTFNVSVSVPRIADANTCYGAGNIQLIIDGNLLEQWNMGYNCTDHYFDHTFSVQTNVSNNQADIVLKVNAINLGNTIYPRYYGFYNLSVTPNINAPAITTGSLPNQEIGVAYSQTLQASNGTTPYTWNVSAGSLPLGLSLNSSTGEISGIPTSSGLYSFTVQVTDANLQSSYRTFNIIAGVPLSDWVFSTNDDFSDGGDGVIAGQRTIVMGGGGTSGGYAQIGKTVTGLVNGTNTFNVSVSVPRIADVNTCYGASNIQLIIDGNILEQWNMGYNCTDHYFDHTFSVQTNVSNNQAEVVLKINATYLGGTIYGRYYGFYNLSIVSNVEAPIITTNSLPNQEIGVGYSQFLQASGGTEPYTWSKISGNLPPGLSINSSTGEILGTPTDPGFYSFTVQVTDANLQTAQQSLTLTITPGPSISYGYNYLPSAEVGSAYSQTLQAVNGTLPYTWSSENLPPGLSINSSTGEISGTPIDSGLHNFTIQITDANLQSNYRILSLIVGIPISDWTFITNDDFSDGGTGVIAGQRTVIMGGGGTSGGYAELDKTISGLLNGANTFNVSVSVPRIADANTCYSVANIQLIIDGSLLEQWDMGYNCTDHYFDHTFSVQTNVANNQANVVLRINATYLGGTIYPRYYGFYNMSVTPNVTSPVITTVSLTSATVGAAYSQTFQVSGGVSPMSWSITTGSLPAGLSLNSSTGEISGIPTTAGSYDFTAQVTDANSNTATQDLTIVVNPAPEITTTSLPDATLTANYSRSLDVTGGTNPLAWNVPAGSLPSGLTLGSSGTLSGEPTETGTFNFTVRVTDTNGAFDTQDLSLTVNTVPSITTTTLPAGTVSAVYSQMLQVSGGSNPFTWNVISRVLPNGLNLNVNTGEISGTPTTQGNYSFTVQVSDNYSVSDTQALSLIINPAVSITMNSNLPDADVNVSYSQTLSATGGTAPLTWTILSGSLPSGLSLNTSGLLSGTPTATGTFNFTVQATDANNQSATQALSLVVNSALTITTTTLQDATANFAYSQALQASGGTVPLIWSLLSGTLPPGLSVSSSGLISGTPTTPGGYTFTIQVSDAYNQTSSQVLTIQVHPALHITTSNLPNGKIGKNYSHSIHAGGGTDPLVWSTVSGSLPNGLSLDSSSGTISGTPTTTGTFNFTVAVQDANGATSTQVLSITVN